LNDSQRSELLDRDPAAEPATALAKELGDRRATTFGYLPSRAAARQHVGVQLRLRRSDHVLTYPRQHPSVD